MSSGRRKGEEKELERGEREEQKGKELGREERKE